MLSIFFTILAVFVVWTNRATINKIIGRSGNIVDKSLTQIEKVIEVSDIYIEGWSEDAQLSNDINRARKQKDLKDELAKLNEELEQAGLPPVEAKPKQLLNKNKAK